ncbi:MAG TPA: fumarylacetoacetate hydrolase family protein, partial [Devosiaceae bacterium]|nr:fumarylacetoacetate hydrolase family protein [Devosiaceae bacterium]
MRYLSYRAADGRSRFGIADGGSVFDLSAEAPSLIAFLGQAPAAIEAGLARSRAQGAAQALSETRFLPVIERPGKIVCLGLNYADHAREGGFAVPEYPALFLRVTSSLIGHGEAIIRPAASETLDYEAELAVVIGKPGRHVKAENALAHVAGYTLFNDVSVREYQRRSAQWTPGKNFDATGPLGPMLVTPDELPPGGAGLHIECRLNGRVMQSANTADMIFHVPRTIEIISEIMTLEPGDVIATG